MHYIIYENIPTKKVLHTRMPKTLRDAMNFAIPQGKAQLMEEFTATMTDEFRLLDGDSNVLFTGLCKDLAEQDGDNAFAPMDRCEQYGATMMEHRKIGAQDWQEL